VRTIKVSTHDLLFALTNRMPGTSHYLDSETGEVIPVLSFNREQILSMIKAEHGRFLRIAPQSPAKGYEMMKQFAGTVTRTEVRNRLEAALQAEKAFRSFRSTVSEVPSECGRWQRFRVRVMTESLRARLEQKGIQLELIPDEEPGKPV